MAETFKREHAADVFDEITPLITAHYQEIAHFKDIPLDPDWDLYRRMDESGMLRVFTARDEDSKRLIGYAVFFVKANLHYQTSVQAVQDILFIDKARRGFGHTFIEWCDEQLRLEGVDASYHHVKAAHNFGPLLEKMGYQLVDLIYARRL